MPNISKNKEKKTNNTEKNIAGKTCFSVADWYLCLVYIIVSLEMPILYGKYYLNHQWLPK